MRLCDLPYHDGSECYTTPGPYSLGDVIEVRVRVPHALRADRIRLRSTPDGEPRVIEARPERDDAGATWWVAELTLDNPLTSYRFLLTGGAAQYLWLNEAGVSPHEVTDSADFRLLTGAGAPVWTQSAIGYQIFLDRFASSGENRHMPTWAIPQEWHDPLVDDADIGTRQLYGGDFAGIAKRLDHLERLGVNLIYMTPFFPGRSNHRYDASTFGHADPMLGGDAGLSRLIDAAHERGMRVLGDITLNHTGDHHEWFSAARSEPESAEASAYMFGDGPDDYVSWHGVPSLPKLDHRSAWLANRLYSGDDSVIAKYLDAPFGLDGWRVDCANTTGRHAEVDLHHRVAAATARTMRRHRTDHWLIAEHCYDSGTDLQAGSWHGVMAYQWFSRPLWSWLQGAGEISLMAELELPRLDGAEMVASMRSLGADVPWQARAGSMTMLDSHDTARFRTAVGGDASRHRVGVAALMAMPGVPTLFAGSEVGVEGGSMDTCRVPFPWDEGKWDTEQFDHTAAMIAMRTERPALQRGSMRWLDADEHSVTYVRETLDDTVVVRLSRNGGGSATLDLESVGINAPLDVLMGSAQFEDGRVEFGEAAEVTVLGAR